MSYVEQLLAENEQIKFEAHQHPFVFFARIALETLLIAVLLIAAYVITLRTEWEGLSLVLSVVGVLAFGVLISAVIDFLRWRNERFLLTDRRVIHLRGVINKSTIDSSLDKINDVQTRQTFFGRMFNYGDLEVQTASTDGNNYFPQIRAPLEFKREMLNAKAEHDKGPYGVFDPNNVAAYQQGGGPPPARLTQAEVEEQLLRLAELRQKNLINDADFDAKKRDILSRM